MTSLIELAAKVEALACSSNFAICREICSQDFYREIHGDCADDEVPNFLESLDDAMMLVPDRFEKELTDLYGVARVSIGINTASPCYGSSEIGSLAIALTAAALRARAAIEDCS